MHNMKRFFPTILIATLTSMLWFNATAQTNLLPQPSFENFITCPNSLSDIAEAYWDKAPFLQPTQGQRMLEDIAAFLQEALTVSTSLIPSLKPWFRE